MIKNFNQFLFESSNEEDGVIILTDDEMGLFKREPILSNLISKRRVVLTKNKLSFNANDEDLVEILKEFFKI